MLKAALLLFPLFAISCSANNTDASSSPQHTRDSGERSASDDNPADPINPPPQEDSGDGSTTGAPDGAGSTAPPSGQSGCKDKFGITELYPNKPGGESYYLNNPMTDPQSYREGSTFTANNDGSWNVHGRMTNGDMEIRWSITPSTGFDEKQIKTVDQKELASQGFILAPNDWRNVEMTSYWRINSHDTSTQNGEAHIELVARLARSTNDTFAIGAYPANCEATSYHSNTYPMSGRAKFEKDLQHTAGYTANSQDPQKLNALKPFMDSKSWYGIKFVVYNLAGAASVKVEQWVDEQGNDQWKKVLDYTDNGHWGGGHPKCGGTDSTVITWGGPLPEFRADHLLDVDVKSVSIREIQVQ